MHERRLDLQQAAIVDSLGVDGSLSCLQSSFRPCLEHGPDAVGIRVRDCHRLKEVLQQEPFKVSADLAGKITDGVTFAKASDFGYAPYNGTHTHYRAVVVSSLPENQYVGALGRDDESSDADLVDGCNMDAATRTKNCGEQTALAEVLAARGEVQALVLRVVCNREGSERRPVLAAPAPCGECRTFYQPHTAPNLPVVLVPSECRDGQEILVTTFGDLLPLGYLGSDWQNEAADLVGTPGLRSLRVLDRADLNGIPLLALQRAEKALLRSHVPFSGTRSGAAVLTWDGDLPSAPRVEVSPMAGGSPAVVAAFKHGVRQGTTLFRMVAFSSEIDSNIQRLLTPDGVERQYIFEFAQLMGADLPVLMSAPGSEKVLVCGASELFPMGRGPRGSSVPAQIHRYTTVNGEHPLGPELS